MGVRDYEGSEVTVTFDSARCIHARRCVLGLPAVFRAGEKGDWIAPDAAPAEDVLHIGKVCPSGAIRVTRRDGRTAQSPPAVNTVRLWENGPLGFEAELTLRGAPLPSPRAVLCRCGASQRKPFCDGSHAAAGFTATSAPEARESPPLEARDGPLDIAPQEGGPLKVTGNLEIIAGDGHTLNRVRKAFLCRCGQSKNKPYCDGSHKEAGVDLPG